MMKVKVSGFTFSLWENWFSGADCTNTVELQVRCGFNMWILKKAVTCSVFMFYHICCSVLSFTDVIHMKSFNYVLRSVYLRMSEPNECMKVNLSLLVCDSLQTPQS